MTAARPPQTVLNDCFAKARMPSAAQPSAVARNAWIAAICVAAAEIMLTPVSVADDVYVDVPPPAPQGKSEEPGKEGGTQYEAAAAPEPIAPPEVAEPEATPSPSPPATARDDKPARRGWKWLFLVIAMLSAVGAWLYWTR